MLRFDTNNNWAKAMLDTVEKLPISNLLKLMSGHQNSVRRTFKLQRLSRHWRYLVTPLRQVYNNIAGSIANRMTQAISNGLAFASQVCILAFW